MKLQSLRMAVAVAPDRAERAGAVDEGIVGRDATVSEDAVDFAEWTGEVLRVVLSTAITDREK